MCVCDFLHVTNDLAEREFFFFYCLQIIVLSWIITIRFWHSVYTLMPHTDTSTQSFEKDPPHLYPSLFRSLESINWFNFIQWMRSEYPISTQLHCRYKHCLWSIFTHQQTVEWMLSLLLPLSHPAYKLMHHAIKKLRTKWERARKQHRKRNNVCALCTDFITILNVCVYVSKYI